MNISAATVLRAFALALLSLCILHQPAHAEPYLAVQKGLKCGMCHVSPAGGGKRTVYGNVFGQVEASARTLVCSERSGALD